jgi:hypothetical protein
VTSAAALRERFAAGAPFAEVIARRIENASLDPG